MPTSVLYKLEAVPRGINGPLFLSGFVLKTTASNKVGYVTGQARTQ